MLDYILIAGHYVILAYCVGYIHAQFKYDKTINLNENIGIRQPSQEHS